MIAVPIFVTGEVRHASFLQDNGSTNQYIQWNSGRKGGVNADASAHDGMSYNLNSTDVPRAIIDNRHLPKLTTARR
jgi:hypothetical protein